MNCDEVNSHGCRVLREEMTVIYFLALSPLASVARLTLPLMTIVKKNATFFCR
jgi:hypothetical protein